MYLYPSTESMYLPQPWKLVYFEITHFQIWMFTMFKHSFRYNNSDLIG